MTASVSKIYREGIFDGKVAFVTGGAGSICRGQVEALVSLGADAVIVGRRQNVLDKAASEIAQLRSGARVVGIAVDVRDDQSLKAAVDRAIAQFGRLDLLICGAAGNFLAPVDNLSANAFKQVVAIDLLGTFNTVKAAIPHLKKTKGKIIFVSATLHYTGVPFQSHVAAAKAGIDALAKNLAVEYGPWGITTNVIAPGPIGETEGMSRLLPQELKDKADSAIPMQRMGRIQDIADATVFLFTDAAQWINGAILVVDGGAWLRDQSGPLPYPQAVLEPAKALEGMTVAGAKGDKKGGAKL